MYFAQFKVYCFILMHIAENILYFYCSFNDAVSNRDHVTPDPTTEKKIN